MKTAEQYCLTGAHDRKNMTENMNKTGKVYLVGAGPGDPDLITVKGLNCLARAEVVVYDYLASPRLLYHVAKEAALIYVGKHGGGHHACSQTEINQILVEKARAGLRVVRLKGGDPFIFGRGGEEIEELVKAGILFEVIPGVTSAVAAATYAGIPITHRAYTSTVAFITGHEDPTKPDTRIAWDKIATGVGTLVIYMGIKNLSSIMEKLTTHGRDPKTPVAVVRWASTPEQQSVQGTIEDIVDKVKEVDLRPPCIVVVGEVVKLRDMIGWFEQRPLFGRRILVTRSRDQASELVRRLEDLGARCIECATIAIIPPDRWDEVDRELDQLDRYDWLIFTSANGVAFFLSRLLERGMDLRALKGLKIAAVGDKTALALKDYYLRPDLVPREFKGEGLSESFLALGVKGKRFLFPRALKAREILPETLTTAGAEVVVLPVYQNVVPVGQEKELLQELQEKRIDLVTFTSSSTVTNFFKLLDCDNRPALMDLIAGVTVAAIGPVTARTVQEEGLTVHIQPEKYTIEAMVEAIVAFYNSPEPLFPDK